MLGDRCINKINLSKLFTFFAILVIIIFVVWLTQADSTGFPVIFSGQLDSINEGYRFIGIRYVSFDCGLGNRIFEVISIIGIARELGRIPYIESEDEKRVRELLKFEKIFSNLGNLVHIKSSAKWNRVNVTYGDKCCTYYDVDSLKNYVEDAIFLSGRHFQSYLYFDYMRDEIRKFLLSFEEEDIVAARTLLFDAVNLTDNSYRVCVHTRRGDFVGPSDHRESNVNFTLAATKFVTELNQRRDQKIFFFGDDKKWMSSNFAERDDIVFPVYISGTGDKIRPSADLAFSSLFCDDVIITASVSTFGFWMGYLAKDGATVYYNQVFATEGGYFDELKPKDYFPPRWKPLILENDSVEYGKITF